MHCLSCIFISVSLASWRSTTSLQSEDNVPTGLSEWWPLLCTQVSMVLDLKVKRSCSEQGPCGSAPSPVGGALLHPSRCPEGSSQRPPHLLRGHSSRRPWLLDLSPLSPSENRKMNLQTVRSHPTGQGRPHCSPALSSCWNVFRCAFIYPFCEFQNKLNYKKEKQDMCLKTEFPLS